MIICHHIITWHDHNYYYLILYTAIYNYMFIALLSHHIYFTHLSICLVMIGAIYDWLVGLINGRVKRYNWFRLSLFNLLSQHHMAHYKYTCPGIITQTYITSIRSWYSSIILGLGFIYLLFGQGLAVNCLFIPSTIKK